MSCYVKIIDGQTGTPVFGNGNNAQGYFSFVGTGSMNDSSYRKIPLGNNIWRVVASSNAHNGGTNFTGFLRWTSNYTGSNGTGSIEITGLQIESGSGIVPYETSYIPTTTGAVTRAGDSISLSNIYTNGFISLTGGTWFVNFKNNTVISGDNTTGMFLGSSPTVPTTGDSLHFRGAGPSGRHKLWKTLGSSTSTVYDTTSDNCKIAMTWNGSFLNVFENGTRVVTSSSFGATSSLQNLAIPSFAGRPINIDSMALFPTALSDAECIALTT